MAKDPPKPKRKPSIEERFPPVPTKETWRPYWPQEKPTGLASFILRILEPSLDEPKRIFDPGDTGPMDRPEGVKGRHHELADVEYAADQAPYIRDDFTKLGRELFLKKHGYEGLAAIINPKFWPHVMGAYAPPGYKWPEEVKQNLEEEGRYLHAYPHYRTEDPGIIYKAMYSPSEEYINNLTDAIRSDLIKDLLENKWKKKYTKSSERQRDLRRIEQEAKERTQDIISRYKHPENVRKSSRDVVSHEYGHELEYNPISPTYGEKAEGLLGWLGEEWDQHELIYLLEGLRGKELAGTSYSFEELPGATRRQEDLVERYRSDPAFAKKITSRKKSIPEILEYLKGR